MFIFQNSSNLKYPPKGAHLIEYSEINGIYVDKAILQSIKELSAKMPSGNSLNSLFKDRGVKYVCLTDGRSERKEDHFYLDSDFFKKNKNNYVALEKHISEKMGIAITKETVIKRNEKKSTDFLKNSNKAKFDLAVKNSTNAVSVSQYLDPSYYNGLDNAQIQKKLDEFSAFLKTGEGQRQMHEFFIERTKLLYEKLEVKGEFKLNARQKEIINARLSHVNLKYEPAIIGSETFRSVSEFNLMAVEDYGLFAGPQILYNSINYAFSSKHDFYSKKVFIKNLWEDLDHELLHIYAGDFYNPKNPITGFSDLLKRTALSPIKWLQKNVFSKKNSFNSIEDAAASNPVSYLDEGMTVLMCNFERFYPHIQSGLIKNFKSIPENEKKEMANLLMRAYLNVSSPDEAKHAYENIKEWMEQK